MAGKFVTWLGEDHPLLAENENGETESSEAPGPSFMFWDRVRFDRYKPVWIDPDQEGLSPILKNTFTHILAKAAKNKFFRVKDAPELEPGHDHGGEGDEEHVDRKPRIQPPPKRKR
jgi:hypothetical protein